MKEDRKIVHVRGMGTRYEMQWFLELQQAILDGYRIADNGLLADTSRRNYKGNSGRAVLYKEGSPSLTKPVVDSTPEPSSEPAETAIEQVEVEDETNSEVATESPESIEEEKVESEDVPVVEKEEKKTPEKEQPKRRGRKPKA